MDDTDKNEHDDNLAPDTGQQKLDIAKAYLKSDDPERVQNNTMRHQYRVLNDEEKAQMMNVKDLGIVFLDAVDKLGNKREYSLAKTKIEEAVMWAVKGITG